MFPPVLALALGLYSLPSRGEVPSLCLEGAAARSVEAFPPDDRCWIHPGPARGRPADGFDLPVSAEATQRIEQQAGAAAP